MVRELLEAIDDGLPRVRALEEVDVLISLSEFGRTPRVFAQKVAQSRSVHLVGCLIQVLEAQLFHVITHAWLAPGEDSKHAHCDHHDDWAQNCPHS